MGYMCEMLRMRGFGYKHPQLWGQKIFDRILDLVLDHESVSDDITYLSNNGIGIVYTSDEYRTWIYFINYATSEISYVPIKYKYGEDMIYDINKRKTQGLACLTGIYSILYGGTAEVREID